MMVRWCIRLTRLTPICEVIRYHLVQVKQNLNKIGTKVRLAVFTFCWQRNQVWDNASLVIIEGFRVSSSSSRALPVGHRNQRGVRELRSGCNLFFQNPEIMLNFFLINFL